MKEDIKFVENLNEEQLQEVTGGCDECNYLLRMGQINLNAAQEHLNNVDKLQAQGKWQEAATAAENALGYQKAYKANMSSLNKINHNS